MTLEIQKIFEVASNNLWDTEYEKNFRLWTSHVPTVMFWFGITLKYKNASRILDIGCGCGRNSSYLAQMGYSVTGIDMSSAGIQKAREYSTLQDLKSTDFIKTDASSLPLKKNFFDGIICLFTLSFLDREECKKSIS
jgi:2-polyprenyl-3-methyl-5-hydroxy-6-metoxy-1,4-benzoquinol methylase